MIMVKPLINILIYKNKSEKKL